MIFVPVRPTTSRGVFIVEFELSALIWSGLIQVIEIYLYNQILSPRKLSVHDSNTWCPRLYAGSKCFILFLFFMFNDMVIVVLMLIYLLTSQFIAIFTNRLEFVPFMYSQLYTNVLSFDSNQYTYLNKYCFSINEKHLRTNKKHIYISEIFYFK